MRLPENFEKKMRDLLKEDFDDYIACYEEVTLLWASCKYE